MSLEPILIGFIVGLVGRDIWSLLTVRGGGDDGSGGSRSKPRKRR